MFLRQVNILVYPFLRHITCNKSIYETNKYFRHTCICFCDKKNQKFTDNKWIIRIRKSKKDRQHNGQKKKNKRTNNDLQNNNCSRHLYIPKYVCKPTNGIPILSSDILNTNDNIQIKDNSFFFFVLFLTNIILTF